MSGEALTPAFVLHRHRYGDTGLLVELFTREEGRIPAVARGAASLKSRRRASLQPFVPLLASWKGRGPVTTLARIEVVVRATGLTGRGLYSGFYVNELLTRLLPRFDPAPALFRHYQDTLVALRQEESLERTLRHFELRLLDELGYAPDLRHEAGGASIREEGWYRYHHESGFHRSDAAAEDSYSGKTLLALAANRPLAGESQRQARRLMRTILAFYLGERPLKSRELFRTMQPDSSSLRKIS